MPVFMDLHVGQGLTAKDVALAHQADVRLQEKFHCHCLTYWMDEKRGNAYCLIDAPNKEAVYELHRNSHKQLPDEIIEVNRRVVKAFLGRIHDPEVVDYLVDQKLKVFNDPGFRVILMIHLKDRKRLIFENGEQKAEQYLIKFEKISENLITKHNGVAAEREDNITVATFTSAIQAVSCSIELQNFLHSESKNLNLKMAIHAGHPVDKSLQLFGKTLRFTEFLCCLEKKYKISISYTVKNLMESAHHSSLLNSPLINCVSKADENFLENLLVVIYENWQNPNFEMDSYLRQMSMSKSQLYRHCLKTTGISFNRLLRDFRLHKALMKLNSTHLNVAETAFETGFNSPSYFTRCFLKHFKMHPSTYLDSFSS